MTTKTREITKRFKETELGKIPEKWQLICLGELLFEKGYIRGPFGSSLLRRELKSEGIPVYEQEHAIYNSRIFRYYIDTEKYEEMKRFTVKENDLIISCSGTFGKVSLITKNDPKGIISQALLILRPDTSKILPEYLKYFFISSLGYQSLASRSIGSVQVNLARREIIENIFLPLPDLHEQLSITKILCDLDAKIELNLRMNETLESTAQALFKRWFVDFDFPNKNGKPYKSSSGKMIGSELGEIPQKWSISKLGDIGAFKNGINYLRDEIGDTDFFIANVRDIANNKLLLRESLDKISINLSKAKEYLLQDKDILIARSASPGEISLVLGNLEKVIYSGFSIRYRLNNPDNYLYIFHVMQGLKKNLQNYSIGTTLQSVNQETLKNMKFILPSDEILKEFNKISKQILDNTLNSLLQNRELSQIRDSLLPRLMNGALRVNGG